MTELLAVVLAAHREFAHHLLRAAGIPARGEVEVSTQVRTDRGKIVDMELVSLDSDDGTLLGRLWSEHKTGSAYSPGQLSGYADDLDKFAGPTQLITIVDDLRQVEKGWRWKPLTWQDVAVLAWEAGREGDGLDWRQTAMRPEGEAGQRLLVELLNYLEEEHHTVLDPVTHLHVASFAKTTDTHDVLSTLLERAAGYSDYDADGSVDWPKYCFSQYWQKFTAQGTWAEPLEGWPELTIAESDEWTDDRTGEPAFGAGFTLPGDVEDALRSAERRSWRNPLELNGVSIREWDGHVRVYRTMYLAELIAKGPTVDAQARALAKWTDESINIVAAHDPQIVRAPQVKRRRGGSSPRAEVVSGEPKSSATERDEMPAS